MVKTHNYYTCVAAGKNICRRQCRLSSKEEEFRVPHIPIHFADRMDPLSSTTTSPAMEATATEVDLRLLEAASSGQTDLVLQLLEEEGGQRLHSFKDQVSHM